MKRPLKRKKPSHAMPSRRAVSRDDRGSEQRTSSASDIEHRYAFRRNRTITGSTSNDIRSGNELNAQVRSPRAQAHHLSSLRRRVLFYLGTVFVAAFVLYLLLNQMIAAAVIKVEGTPSVAASDTAGYQASLDSYFSARPFERLRFTLNTAELLSHLQTQHPEVEKLTVTSVDQPGKALVTLRPRSAIARWNVAGKKQYVDSKGVVFERNYGADPQLQIIDNSGVADSGSGAVASRRFLGFIGIAVGLAKDNGLSVSEIIIPSLTSRQVDLKLAGVVPYYKLSVDRSVGEQIEDLTRVQRHLVGNQLQPEYIDLRVEGKAFYR